MKALQLIFSVILILCLASCGGEAQNADVKADAVAVTDALGNTAYLSSNSRIAFAYASFAECWLLSGGTAVGVTEDAISEHGLDVGDAVIIGSVKHIDMEALAATQPDYVVLSADLTAHMSLEDSLRAMGIAYGYFRVDTFEDYSAMMRSFCNVTGRDDLFSANVEAVAQRILEIKDSFPETDATYLLIRAYSTGMKAKADDNLAGVILSELGLTNIVPEGNGIDELSVEYIVEHDPDYIFALTMGSVEGAEAYLKDNAESNPAWAGLSAVKNGRYNLLPRELFHYKPNNRWDESYEYLARLIRPDAFGE